MALAIPDKKSYKTVIHGTFSPPMPPLGTSIYRIPRPWFLNVQGTVFAFINQKHLHDISTIMISWIAQNVKYRILHSFKNIPADRRFQCRILFQRSFKVINDNTAQIPATIQKRTVNRWLGIPNFSKWWWIGAIRKIRLPRRAAPGGFHQVLTAATRQAARPPARPRRRAARRSAPDCQKSGSRSRNFFPFFC